MMWVTVPPVTTAHINDALDLGVAIRSERLALGMTKAEAARRAGVSRRTWHEIEEGQRSVTTAETLACFDDALRQPPGTFLSMTSKGRAQEVEQLRRRLVDLVRTMNEADLREAVDAAEGRDTILTAVRDEQRQVRDALAALTEKVEQLSRDGGEIRRAPDEGPMTNDVRRGGRRAAS